MKEPPKLNQKNPPTAKVIEADAALRIKMVRRLGDLAGRIFEP